MSKVPRQTNTVNPSIRLRGGADDLPGRVVRAVIDEDQFPGAVELVEDSHRSLDEERQRPFLVERGCDDTQVHSRLVVTSPGLRAVSTKVRAAHAHRAKQIRSPTGHLGLNPAKKTFGEEIP